MRKTARALIVRGNKILLVSGHGADFYWTPGGGIENNETPEIALSRELKEELGIETYKYDKFIDYIVGDQDVTNFLVMTSEDIQPEAEIDKIVWASRNDIEEVTIKVSDGFKKNAFIALVENNLL
jgi:ADP-ribose pyrophosphatase YjhB (NUDIX family)